jgi:hypothetical protein
LEIDTLAEASGFHVESLWVDPTGKFSLSMFAPSPLDKPNRNIEQELTQAWAFSDKVFDLLKDNAWLEQPISLRHPFIFYLGHLPAFANNQINYVLNNQKSVSKYFDQIFERGIDPNVDTMECHAHSEVPQTWPEISEIKEYRNKVRKHALQAIQEVLDKKDNFMAIKGRVFSMAAEHDYMVSNLVGNYIEDSVVIDRPLLQSCDRVSNIISTLYGRSVY